MAWRNQSTVPALISKIMRRRSESELPSKAAPQLKGLTAKEQHLRQGDEGLKRKVDESRPLLEAIYDKVRKKEQMYQDSIASNKERQERAAGLASEYRELGCQAIRVINDCTLMRQQEP